MLLSSTQRRTTHSRNPFVLFVPASFLLRNAAATRSPGYPIVTFSLGQMAHTPMLQSMMASSLSSTISNMSSLRTGSIRSAKFANGLWIGAVPLELQDLTLPEQLLVSLHFPRVSFALNTEKIADMLTGQLLPRPPRVLASVIAVSIIGKGRLPKKWLNTTFRVRRRRVYEALLWLKQNNPLCRNRHQLARVFRHGRRAPRE